MSETRSVRACRASAVSLWYLDGQRSVGSEFVR